jgi:1-phosphatidylinositol phosphodiesterase
MVMVSRRIPRRVRISQCAVGGLAVAVLAAAAGIGLGVAPAMAHSDGAYSHDGWSGNQQGWMAPLYDRQPLSQLSIPGTHDSMSTGPGGDTTQTQSMSLAQQLAAGIRFIDIRLNNADGQNLFLYHGPVALGGDFDDVLSTVSTFLVSNPTETVLMRVRQESSSQPDATFNAAVGQALSGYPSRWQAPTDTADPTLGQVRGKFVIYSDADGLPGAIDYRAPGHQIQDAFNLGTNWDLYGKWEQVKAQLSAADSGYGSGSLYVNYLSGSGGAFPYFVASGHSSPGTDAPRLLTGLTTPGSNAYPDFPRVGCLGVICSIAFEGTNTLTRDYITANRPESVGIVVADFPGASLIDSIIGLNPKAPTAIAAVRNIAPKATVATSSEYMSAYSGAKVGDGIIGRQDVGEWASAGQLSPTIVLSWGAVRTVNGVVLFDRNNLVDSIGAGTLSFSDGSQVQVGALPNDGSAHYVSFSEKNVSWATFTASGSGLNVGLSEVQVWATAFPQGPATSTPPRPAP